MQKVNANKFGKGNPQSMGMSGAHLNKFESNSDKPPSSSSNAKGGAPSSISGPPENQTISSNYKTNLEQKTMQTVTRAQKKLRTESRQDMRAISVGATNDYMDGS